MTAPTNIGKYEIRRQIGRGAMGTVFEAFDPVIERRVAIKTLRLELFEQSQIADVRSRFKREAQSAGQLAHPHIVTVYDYGEQDGTPYIVMEILAGNELSKILSRGARLPLSEVVRLMTQLLGALTYAHERKVVHRDVKPGNIFILDDGSLKVVDFGLAHVEASNLTDTGALLGTPAYMSPEQFLALPVDERSDIFSVGVILYELLTGDKPFTGSVTSIMQKVLRQEPMEPSALNPTLSTAWDAVVKRAMAKKPDDRFQTARQFSETIKQVFEKGALNVSVEITLTGAEPADLRGATLRPGANKQEVADVPRYAPSVKAAPDIATTSTSYKKRVAIAAIVIAIAFGAASFYLLQGSRNDVAKLEPDCPPGTERRINGFVDRGFDCVSVGTVGAIAKIASDKAAADAKAVADKAAADARATADKAADAKTEAEKVARQTKAAQERADQEKAADAKKMAEKARADKLAAEKAKKAGEEEIRQKAAAEVTRLEKLRAEKAEAERRATEKAAAEKLDAERGAAEKVAADRAVTEKMAASRVEAERNIADKAKKDGRSAADANRAGEDFFNKQMYAQAVEQYRIAAILGSAQGQANLAAMYRLGRGVAPDYSEALRWNRKAAEQNLAIAQNNLGDMYRNGWGVTKDYAEAVRWYRNAADQNQVSAQSNLGFMYMNGFGVSRDDIEAVGWFRKAAERASAIAQFNLGFMYENGRGGLSTDVETAISWYRLAARQGRPEATAALKRLGRE